MWTNTLGNLMRKMKENSPLHGTDKRMTNHSARKTVVKKLQKHGVQKSKITSITGHRSTKGLDSYDEGDENQQRILSNIIDGEISHSITPASSSLPSASVSQLSLQRPKAYERQRPKISQPLQIRSINSITPSIQVSRPRQQPALAHVSQFQGLRPVQQIFNISHCQLPISSTPNLPACPAVNQLELDEDRFNDCDYQLFDGYLNDL